MIFILPKAHVDAVCSLYSLHAAVVVRWSFAVTVIRIREVLKRLERITLVDLRQDYLSVTSRPRSYRYVIGHVRAAHHANNA